MVKNRFELTEIREDICPNCGGKDFDFGKNGEITCTTCALVVGVHSLDLTKEEDRFNYEDSGKLSRLGPPNSRIFGFSTKFFTSDSIKSDNRAKLDRLSRLNQRQEYKELTWKSRMSIISRAAESLNIPPYVVGDASEYLNKALEGKLLAGRNVEDLTGAILHLACRKNYFPVPLKDIAKATGAKRRGMTRIYRKLFWGLGIKPLAPGNFEFMDRLADELDIKPPVRRLARQFVRMAYESGVIFGKSSRTTPTAAIYCASMFYEPLNQIAVANKARITEVSLRNRANDIKNFVEMFKKYHSRFSTFEPSGSYEEIIADYFKINPDELMAMMSCQSTGLSAVSNKIFEYGSIRFGRSKPMESREKLNSALNHLYSYIKG